MGMAVLFPAHAHSPVVVAVAWYASYWEVVIAPLAMLASCSAVGGVPGYATHVDPPS